jgi:hypothetical protein
MSLVLADDALIVLLATLARRALVEPVVAQVVERLGRRRGVADAAPDLVDLDLVPREFGLGALVVVADGALTLAVLVEPADAPVVAMLAGLRHDRSSLPRARSPVSCSTFAIPCRERVGPRSCGPRMAQE